MNDRIDRLPEVPSDVRAIRVNRYACYYCGAAQGWAPIFDDPFDKGYQCHRCGATSVRVREGRPVGRRSKDWPAAEEAVRWGLDLNEPSITADIEEALVR
jgi:hypothetical protein